MAHLDLKGIQPLPEKILEYLETISALGYDGVLVEYEDIFPYSTEERIAIYPGEVWSRSFLREFLAKARQCGLEVIPLQQSLGHLEYFFRWRHFRRYGLREGYPSTLAIDDLEARRWMQSLLVEMMRSHSDSRFIHLGMDEAYALEAYAATRGARAMEWFLDYLEELCELCAREGKIALIWADMLCKDFSPQTLAGIRRFRDRVILVHWDYGAKSATTAVARLAGVRCSQTWLDHPDAPDAPYLVESMQWMEDWPPEVQSIVEKYRVSGTHLESLFTAAIWKELGFTVIGACAGGVSAEGPLLPNYHHRMQNIDCWAEALRKWKLDGLLVTVWARSNSCRRPNAVAEVILPLLADAARKVRPRSTPLFEGISPDRVSTLLKGIGRCRENHWGIEGWISKEMALLEPALKRGCREWQTIALMVRILAVIKSAEAMGSGEVALYHCGNRLMPSEWKRRMEANRKTRAHLEALREEALAHLAPVYRPDSLAEWFCAVFDLPIARLREVDHEMKKRLALAETFFDG